MKGDIGGVRLVDRSNVQTLFGGEGVRHHSVGWYGHLEPGWKNGVTFHNWRVTTREPVFRAWRLLTRFSRSTAPWKDWSMTGRLPS